MKIVKIGHSENGENGSGANGGLNGRLNGRRHITKGSVVRLFDGSWSAGVVEQVIRTRYRGEIRTEFEVLLSDGCRAYFLAESPATERPLSFLERLSKIAYSCPRAARGADGNWLAAG